MVKHTQLNEDRQVGNLFLEETSGEFRRVIKIYRIGQSALSIY